jgi:hypothetical protein
MRRARCAPPRWRCWTRCSPWAGAAGGS